MGICWKVGADADTARAVVVAVWVWGHTTGKTKWLAGRGYFWYGMCERDSGSLMPQTGVSGHLSPVTSPSSSLFSWVLSSSSSLAFWFVIGGSMTGETISLHLAPVLASRCAGGDEVTILVSPMRCGKWGSRRDAIVCSGRKEGTGNTVESVGPK